MIVGDQINLYQRNLALAHIGKMAYEVNSDGHQYDDRHCVVKSLRFIDQL